MRMLQADERPTVNASGAAAAASAAPRPEPRMQPIIAPFRTANVLDPCFPRTLPFAGLRKPSADAADHVEPWWISSMPEAAKTDAGSFFGKYCLMKKLAAGGVGEIYLAKQQGPA